MIDVHSKSSIFIYFLEHAEEHKRAIHLLYQNELWLGSKHRKLREYLCNTWLTQDIVQVLNIISFIFLFVV